MTLSSHRHQVTQVTQVLVCLGLVRTTVSSEKSKMESGDSDGNPLPWHHGVFDAHCHPTDTMASIEQIPSMRATALTVMATRNQDQELVSRIADGHRISEATVKETPPSQWRGIVPSFGWHPWFSHHLFDDNSSDFKGLEKLDHEQEIKHYRAALNPTVEDDAFIEQLPDAAPLSQFIAETRNRLKQHPFALVGEVGLDKGFRLPEAWRPSELDERDQGLTPGGREGRRLSPYRVNMPHQKRILQAQLRLAGELQRAVSCHGVQAHGILYETIRETWKGHERPVLSKKEQKQAGKQPNLPDHGSGIEPKEIPPLAAPSPQPFPPRLCLHSYSGPVGPVSQYTHPSVPIDIFFSFSMAINFSTPAASKTEEVIKAVPGNRILVESDLHTAGPDMDRYLEAIVRKVCELKGWTLENGMRQLSSNWRRFVFGIGEEVFVPRD